MKVLLSIKPEFVQKIFFQSKKYEFRKIIFKKDVESVAIYCTMPIGRIVGEFTIADILADSPEEIWTVTKNYAGISKKYYDEYFKGKQTAYAIKIGNLLKYEVEIDPFIKFPNFVAPQSFRYFNV
jgi:predicted transcriptional regulator